MWNATALFANSVGGAAIPVRPTRDRVGTPAAAASRFFETAPRHRRATAAVDRRTDARAAPRGAMPAHGRLERAAHDESAPRTASSGSPVDAWNSRAGTHNSYIRGRGSTQRTMRSSPFVQGRRARGLRAARRQVMTSPIETIDIHQPLSAALDLLHVTGLIVTEDGQPVGMFTQANALASRDQPRSTPIEAVRRRGDLPARRDEAVPGRGARRRPARAPRRGLQGARGGRDRLRDRLRARRRAVVSRSSSWTRRAQRAPVRERRERPKNPERCGVPRGHTGPGRHVGERGVLPTARRAGDRLASQRRDMARAGRLRDRPYERGCPARHVAC